jgi:type VI secretion system secreted protein Hcp
MNKRIALHATTLALFLAAAGPSSAATDIFLNITDPTGFAGEATAGSFKGDIQLLSYSQSFDDTTTVATGTGGGAAGKFSCGVVKFTKRIDKSSPEFIKAVMTGERIKTAVVYFADTTGNGTLRTDYSVALVDARVTSVSQSDASPAELVESVSLEASQFTVHYVPAGKAGGAGSSSGAVEFHVDCIGKGVF